MEKFQQSQQSQQLPDFREVPKWSADERIEVTGKEFELLYNFITNVGDAYSAANSVMSRNILNGKITVDFEKLAFDADGQPYYKEASEEEKAVKKAEYDKLINSIKANQESQVAPMPEEFIPVDDTGVQIIQP